MRARLPSLRLVASSLLVLASCVRVPEASELETPEAQAAATCPEPDAFAGTFTRERERAWLEAIAGNERDASWRRSWSQSVAAGLDQARIAHREAFERSCIANLEQPESWARHQACFAQARAQIEARLEIAAQLGREEPDLLAQSPTWPWRLRSFVARCESPDVVAAYLPFDPARDGPERERLAEALTRAWAMAELGLYDEAYRIASDQSSLLETHADERLAFEAELLSAWLMLADADWREAESTLPAARTAAAALGPAARMELDFLEAAVAGFAADLPRARDALTRAASIATRLGPGFEHEQIEAELEAALASSADDPRASAQHLARAWTGLLALDKKLRDPATWLMLAQLRVAAPKADEGTADDLEAARQNQRERLGAEHPAVAGPVDEGAAEE